MWEVTNPKRVPISFTVDNGKTIIYLAPKESKLIDKKPDVSDILIKKADKKKTEVE